MSDTNPYASTVTQLESDAVDQRAAAKSAIQNMLDLAAQESPVVLNTATSDTLALIRSYLPQSNTAALTFFDEVASGVQKDATTFLNAEIALAFIHARDLLNSAIPSSSTVSGTATAGAKAGIAEVQATEATGVHHDPTIGQQGGIAPNQTTGTAPQQLTEELQTGKQDASQAQVAFTESGEEKLVQTDGKTDNSLGHDPTAMTNANLQEEQAPKIDQHPQ